MTCPNCGAPTGEGKRFCTSCGSPLVPPPVPEPGTAAPGPAAADAPDPAVRDMVGDPAPGDRWPDPAPAPESATRDRAAFDTSAWTTAEFRTIRDRLDERGVGHETVEGVLWVSATARGVTGAIVAEVMAGDA